MITFLTQPNVIVAIIAGALLLVWKFWPTISKYVPSFGFSRTTGSDDALDVAAFRRLKKRVTSEEGRAALKVVWACLNDDEVSGA